MTPRLTKRQEAMIEANMGCLVMFLGVFAVPFAAACVFFVVMGVTEARDQTRLHATAVEVPAVITESSVAQSTVGTRSTGSSRVFRPMVSYAYEFEGEPYTSDRVWAIHQSRSEQGWAERVVRRYRVGREVPAFVDPTDPGRAFLEQQWSTSPHTGALMGVALLEFIALGLVFILAWRWYGWFTLGAFTASLGGLMVVGWLGWVWQTTVPADQREGWMLWAIAGASAVCLMPTIALFTSRKRANAYREALGIAAEIERLAESEPEYKGTQA